MVVVAAAALPLPDRVMRLLLFDDSTSFCCSGRSEPSAIASFPLATPLIDRGNTTAQFTQPDASTADAVRTATVRMVVGVVSVAVTVAIAVLHIHHHHHRRAALVGGRTAAGRVVAAAGEGAQISRDSNRHLAISRLPVFESGVNFHADSSFCVSSSFALVACSSALSF
uniref:Uncharacterized protein n=1 Tax=Anopheles melas TaxID=34690 RepID=A0A182UIC0_9DIPT